MVEEEKTSFLETLVSDKKRFFVAGGLLILNIGLFAYSIYAARLYVVSERNMASSKEEIGENFDPSRLVWKNAGAMPFGARDSETSYVFKGRMFITGGLDANAETKNGYTNYEKAKYYNDIWWTEDGVNWKLGKEHAEFPLIRSSSIFELNGKLFLLAGWSPEVGYNIGIWTSTDGLNWTKEKPRQDWGDREGQRIVLFMNKIWMIGGTNYFAHKTYNDVWVSENGLDWTQATEDAGWHSRWDHDVAEYKGKLWLAGGMNFGGIGYGDIWSSDDAINWVQVSDNPPFGARQGQCMLQYRGLLWLIGGLDANTNAGVGDSWYTSDGKNWRKVAREGDWPGKEDHVVNTFRGRMILGPGMNNLQHWDNDVWYSEF